MTNDEMALEYYKAGLMQHSGVSAKPKYVPKIIELTRTVRSDFSYHISERIIAKPGVYEAHCNPYGAVSVVASNGKLLGVKPNEFEVVEWQVNPAELSDSAGRTGLANDSV